jgi:RNA polymerase subunit RPABC4/transcription elongation factor Spt4
MSVDRCVVCSEIVPEGRMVCGACEMEAKETSWQAREL